MSTEPSDAPPGNYMSTDASSNKVGSYIDAEPKRRPAPDRRTTTPASDEPEAAVTTRATANAFTAGFHSPAQPPWHRLPSMDATAEAAPKVVADLIRSAAAKVAASEAA